MTDITPFHVQNTCTYSISDSAFLMAAAAASAVSEKISDFIQSLFELYQTDRELKEISLRSKHLGFSKEGKFIFNTCFNLYPGLKKRNWDSMTLQEKTDIMTYFTATKPCDPLKQKLINEATKETKKIANELGYNETEKITVILTNALKTYNNVVEMSAIEAIDLIGWYSPEKQQHTTGCVAHEIGHMFYKHSPVTLLPIDCSEEEFRKKIEIEADLFTLRVPRFARYLRYQFKEIFDDCFSCKDCTDQEYCTITLHDTDTHPALTTRINVLTEGLCKQYPQLNTDICPYIPLSPPKSDV